MKASNEQLSSLNTIVNSLLTIIYGITLLTNVLVGGKISATIGNWYELLAILMVCVYICNACFRNAPQYIILIFSYVGAYFYLRLSRADFGGRGYVMNIPILFICIGLGFFISYFATKGNSGFMKTAIVLIGGSFFFLIASYMNIYNLIVPALIVGISFIIMIFAIIRHIFQFSIETKTHKIDDKLDEKFNAEMEKHQKDLAGQTSQVLTNGENSAEVRQCAECGQNIYDTAQKQQSNLAQKEVNENENTDNNKTAGKPQ